MSQEALVQSPDLLSAGRSIDLEHLMDLNERAWANRRASPADALDLAHEARYLAISLGSDRELARSLCTLGNLLANDRADDAAEGYLREALRLCEVHGDDTTAAWSLYGLTRFHYRRGDTRGALAAALQAHDRASELDIKMAEAAILNVIGSIYRDLGVFQQALTNFRSSLDLYNAIDEGYDYVVPLYNLRLIYLELGEYQKALAFAEPALAAFERNGDASNAAGALMSIGEIHAYLGNHDRSMVCLEAALERFERLRDDRSIAQVRYHLGSTFTRIGDHDCARSHFTAALDRHPGDRPDTIVTVRTLIGLADLNLMERRYEEALGHLLQALPVAENGGLKKHLYQVHHGLSKAYKALGSMAEALDHFERFHRHKEEVSEERLKSVMEGMQLQFDVEQDLHQVEIERLANNELARVNQKLRKVSEKLEQQSIRDELTGVFNRRQLNSVLADSYRHAQRASAPLSVVMCDIDHFKRVNDTLSHAVGDQVLRLVASLLVTNLRHDDLVARYGGEEFALVMSGVSLESALERCEQLRASIEHHPWTELHPDLGITMSFGVSDRIDLEHHQELLNAADAMLYRAKRLGRNRVCG